MNRTPIQYTTAWAIVLLAASPAAFAADEEGEWYYNEGGGQTYFDQSGNGLNLIRGSTAGVDANDPSYSSDTPLGGGANWSIDLDGIIDYGYRGGGIELEPAGDFTLSSWVKLDDLTLGGDQDIILSNVGNFGASGGYQLGFGLDGSSKPVVGVMYRNAAYADQFVGIRLEDLATGWTADTWYHVTGTYDDTGANATLAVYVDGKPVASGVGSGNIVYDATPGFYVGTNIDGVPAGGATLDRELNGHLDSTIVFSDLKSDNQIRDLAEIDIAWDNVAGGNASTRTDWNPDKLPSYASNAILPDLGTDYTVNLDADGWEVLSLRIDDGAEADLASHSITLEDGIDLNDSGKLKLSGAHVQGSGSVTSASGTLIYGYGTIGQGLTTNSGTTRAEGGILSIDLNGNDNDGTLQAQTGATLRVRNSADIVNRDTIALSGGTLSPTSGTFDLSNAAVGDSISGYGTIDNYRVDVEDGTLAASGGTLSLLDGFAAANDTGIINVQSGATLAVTGAWTNQNAINLSGGSVTGGTLTQSGNLQVTGGANTIQNLDFSAGSTNALSGNASLHISGTGTLNGATITETGAGGTLVIDNGATLSGQGSIAPDTTVNGTLDASSSGNTLTVSGTLGVSAGHVARATGGGTLTAGGMVTNAGSLYAATGSTLNVNASLTNIGAVYTSGGTTNLTQDVFNHADVYADGGSLTVSGTIKADLASDGDFDARNGAVNINGSIEVGARNTFSADAGGTLTFANDLSTGNLFQGQALFLNGGTIDLAAGKTLTNATDKTIAGHGALLSDGRNLVNDHLIEASGGTLTVHGDIVNNNTMRAEGSGDALIVASSLAISGSGQVAATGGASADLQSPLDNDGYVYAAGGGAVLSVADTSPSGDGTFSAQTGGTILLADGFTNADLTDPDALALDGGTFATTPGGTLTNAAGHRIRGHGTLLKTGSPTQTVDNLGTVETLSGVITMEGDLDNNGTVRASPGDSIQITGTLANHGLVEIGAGAAVSVGSSSADTGAYSISGGQLSVQGDLSLGSDAYLSDNDFVGAVDVVGNFSKDAGAQSLFDADLLDVTVAGREVLVGAPHLLGWGAEDRGALAAGLIDNLALGSLTFGNGLGNPASDTFNFDLGSILYAFGLVIESDAVLDLNGSTLYYLQAGDTVNGILGTGFVNNGGYINGQIIEIDADASGAPAPAAPLLLVSGLGLMAWMRRWGEAGRMSRSSL